MFLLVNKPTGITSHDVVDRIRELTGERRVGHAGTLDPNAEGLLLVGIGRGSTKKLWEKVAGAVKEYEAGVCLGEERVTDDAEGAVRPSLSPGNIVMPSTAGVKKILKEFIGEQMQTPPQFSAIKTKGQKAYESARKGIEISLDPRKITVYSIRLLDFKYPEIKIICRVSGGTYIRSLARDIGRKLGTGAYLKTLVRTRIGNFSLKDSVKLDLLSQENWKKNAFN